MNYSLNVISAGLLLILNCCISNISFSQTYTTGVVNLSNTTGLVMTAKIDIGTQVTLTLTGPSGRWFALGFDASSMASGTDVVGVHSSTTLNAFDCHLTGYSAPVTDPLQNWTISSDAVSGGVRTVVATRPLDTGDANDLVFPSVPTSIGLIWARSSSATFSYSYHGGANRGVTFANFNLVQPPSAPTGAANQTLCNGATLAQLSATGTAIQWYANPSAGTPLASNTILSNGSTYYATQTINGLESVNRLAVTVTLTNVPSAPSAINGSLHFCFDGSGQQYNISSISGATSYLWNTPNGSTGSSTGTNINLLFSPSFQSGNLSVLAQNSCGQSTPINIIINQHLQSSASLNVTSCTPYTFNGQTYTQSGTYSYQGATIWGCDSTVILNLTIAPAINQNLNAEACGSYPWNGQNYFNSGIYVDTFQTINGCDSIVTLDLTVHPIDAISIDSTVFDSFNWNGTIYTSSGTYTQFFTSAFGCDSSVTINLTVSQSGLAEEVKQFSIYPNPAKDQITINGDVSLIGKIYLVFDQVGKVVYKGSIDKASTLLSVTNFSNGVYTLQIDGQCRKTFVVSKE
jgi:hypothetical protein